MTLMLYGDAMRTTVSIDDELLASAKELAARRGQTLGAVVEAALRRELASRAAVPSGPAVPLVRGGRGPRADLDLSSNRSLIAAMDEGVELDKRR